MSSSSWRKRPRTTARNTFFQRSATKRLFSSRLHSAVGGKAPAATPIDADAVDMDSASRSSLQCLQDSRLELRIIIQSMQITPRFRSCKRLSWFTTDCMSSIGTIALDVKPTATNVTSLCHIPARSVMESNTVRARSRHLIESTIVSTISQR